MKFLTRLRLGHLIKHKFKQNFLNCLNHYSLFPALPFFDKFNKSSEKLLKRLLKIFHMQTMIYSSKAINVWKLKLQL